MALATFAAAAALVSPHGLGLAAGRPAPAPAMPVTPLAPPASLAPRAAAALAAAHAAALPFAASAAADAARAVAEVTDEIGIRPSLFGVPLGLFYMCYVLSFGALQLLKTGGKPVALIGGKKVVGGEVVGDAKSPFGRSAQEAAAAAARSSFPGLRGDGRRGQPRMQLAARARGAAPRAGAVAMQEPPFPLPYEVPKMPRAYSDYEWDDDYPGTFKPGKLRENWELDEVLTMWEGRDNPACMELPQDELWMVPLAPAEDILSWLSRIGLMKDDEPEADEAKSNADNLLDDEFDLDDEIDAGSLLSGQKETGATLSDSMEL